MFGPSPVRFMTFDSDHENEERRRWLILLALQWTKIIGGEI
jgi:hypothetical protein